VRTVRKRSRDSYASGRTVGIVTNKKEYEVTIRARELSFACVQERGGCRNGSFVAGPKGKCRIRHCVKGEHEFPTRPRNERGSTAGLSPCSTGGNELPALVAVNQGIAKKQYGYQSRDCVSALSTLVKSKTGQQKRGKKGKVFHGKCKSSKRILAKLSVLVTNYGGGPWGLALKVPQFMGTRRYVHRDRIFGNKKKRQDGFEKGKTLTSTR